MKSIKIRYYASLREMAGRVEETRQTRAQTVAELYGELKGHYGFQLEASALGAAVNDEFVDWQTRLFDGDLVVFIPPVAGGRENV